MSLPVHWLNAERGAGVQPTDRGLSYGDGVFETFRCHSGLIHLWPLHRERLFRGLEVLGIPLAEARLEQQLALACDYLQGHDIADAAGRVTITRGPGDRGYRGATGEASILCSLYPTSPWRALPDPVELVICNSTLSRQPRLAGIKHCNRLEQVLAARELESRGAEDGVLLNDRGELTCALAANIFVVRKGELLTPPVNECGIAGTVRRLVIETLAPEAGIDCRETVLMPSDLADAEEMFLTSSLSGLRQVSHCEGVFFTSSRWGDTLRDSFYRWSESTA